jgi:Ring finger domain
MHFFIALIGFVAGSANKEGETTKEEANVVSLIEAEESLGHSVEKVDEDLCAICLGDLHRTPSEVDAGECHHCFHKKCIGTWILRDHDECPYCRTPISEFARKILNVSRNLHEDHPIRTLLRGEALRDDRIGAILRQVSETMEWTDTSSPVAFLATADDAAIVAAALGDLDITEATVDAAAEGKFV